MFGILRRKEKIEEGVRKSRDAWFGKIARLFQSARPDDKLWEELEELLISADVGVETTGKLLACLRQRVRDEGIGQALQILEALKEEVVAIVDVDRSLNKENGSLTSPQIILVVGVNGAGKTTSIAKLAYHFKAEGRRVILGAADTFRAAAIEQLQVWGERLGVDVVAHRPGSDPGAVAFDAFQAARAREADIVIIDTAGRLHTKYNLMEELKKIYRVLARQEDGLSPFVLLILDATIGQNGLYQARHFTDAVKCDGIFLAKLDGTAKGGIVLAITDELKLPVLYIGTGEKLEDMAAFDPREFVESLFASV